MQARGHGFNFQIDRQKNDFKFRIKKSLESCPYYWDSVPKIAKTWKKITLMVPFSIFLLKLMALKGQVAMNKQACKYRFK